RVFEEEVFRRGEPDALEQRNHRGARSAPVRLLVFREWWGERLGDRSGRVQRGVRILMDELDRTPKAREVVAFLLPDVRALEEEPAAGWPEESGQHSPGRRFS